MAELKDLGVGQAVRFTGRSIIRKGAQGMVLQKGPIGTTVMVEVEFGAGTEWRWCWPSDLEILSTGGLKMSTRCTTYEMWRHRTSGEVYVVGIRDLTSNEWTHHH